MRNYLTVEGRTSRKNFWLFTLIVTVALFVALVIDMVVFSDPGAERRFLFLIVACVHIVPFITAAVRRLHDADLTGWLYLLNALPFGQVIFIVLACLPPTNGPNKYGDAADEEMPVAAHNSYRVATTQEPPMSPVAPTPSAKPVDHRAPEVATATPTPRRNALDDDMLGQLERLASLRANGVIDEAEFAALKLKLMRTA